MMDLEDDLISDLASTLAERIVRRDENAIEAAHILGRILAENGFSFGLMVDLQQKADVLHGEQVEEKLKEDILRWILDLQLLTIYIFTHRKLLTLFVVDSQMIRIN